MNDLAVLASRQIDRCKRRDRCARSWSPRRWAEAWGTLGPSFPADSDPYFWIGIQFTLQNIGQVGKYLESPCRQSARRYQPGAPVPEGALSRRGCLADLGNGPTRVRLARRDSRRAGAGAAQNARMRRLSHRLCDALAINSE